MGLRECDVAARHDSLGGEEEVVHVYFGETGDGAAVGEGGDEGARHARAVDVAADSYDGGGIEHGVDAGLAVIAHDESAELEVGAEEAVGGIVPEAYEVVGVLEVGGHTSGAEIAPAANDGIAEETVVSLVGVAVDDDVVQLAADLAPGPDGGVGVDFGTHVDGGVVADGDGSAEHGAFHDGGVAAYVDRSGGGVEDAALHPGSLFEENAVAGADNHNGVAQRLRGAAGGEAGEVGTEGVAVEEEYVVDVLYDDGRRSRIFAAHRGVAAACHEGVAAPEGGVGAEGGDSGGESRIRNNVAGHEDGIGRVVAGRKKFGEIVLGLPGVAAGEECLPLFGDGGDAEAHVGYGACIGEWQEVFADGVRVE